MFLHHTVIGFAQRTPIRPPLIKRSRTNSKWLRMTRDIANASKHGDLHMEAHQMRNPRRCARRQCEYKIDPSNSAMAHRIVGLAIDATSYDVLDVLRERLRNGAHFSRARGI